MAGRTFTIVVITLSVRGSRCIVSCSDITVWKENKFNRRPGVIKENTWGFTLAVLWYRLIICLSLGVDQRLAGFVAMLVCRFNERRTCNNRTKRKKEKIKIYPVLKSWKGRLVFLGSQIPFNPLPLAVKCLTCIHTRLSVSPF